MNKDRVILYIKVVIRKCRYGERYRDAVLILILELPGNINYHRFNYGSEHIAIFNSTITCTHDRSWVMDIKTLKHHLCMILWARNHANYLQSS